MTRPRPERAPRISRSINPKDSASSLIAGTLPRRSIRHMLVSHPGSPGLMVKIATEKLLGRGAVLTLADDPDCRHLLGDLRWQEGGVFFFIAFGEGPQDARYIAADAIIEEHDGSILFYCGSVLCAKLDDIAAAELEDPDDYRIAWQLWQQISPLRRSLIERSYAAVAEAW